MSTNTLFSNNEDDSNNQNELSGEDAMKLLVGEGKKYATTEDLAKAMVHGQAHITKLESEATSFKETQDKQSSIDDILAAIKAGENNNQQQLNDNQPPADLQKPDLSQPVDIAQQIKDAMAEQAQTNSAVANTQLVTDSLSKSLGARANEVYTAVGKECGVNLDELSKTSPEAVIKLCTGQQNVTTQQSFTPTTQHRSNNLQQAPSTDGAMTHAQIQVLAQETKMTREKKFELEMQHALIMGDHFYDKQ